MLIVTKTRRGWPLGAGSEWAKAVSASTSSSVKFLGLGARGEFFEAQVDRVCAVVERGVSGVEAAGGREQLDGMLCGLAACKRNAKRHGRGFGGEPLTLRRAGLRRGFSGLHAGEAAGPA